MKTLILYGMRWSGKTTIGKLLSSKMDCIFYDLDQVIVDNIGMSVFDFVNTNGWDMFRKIEHENLAKLLKKSEKKVISLGGWAITFQNNQKMLLEKSDKLVYIDCPVGLIQKRIQKDEESGNKRNALTNRWLFEELQEVYENRRDCYESFHDFKVNNIDSVERCIQDIVEKLSSVDIVQSTFDFPRKLLTIS